MEITLETTLETIQQDLKQLKQGQQSLEQGQQSLEQGQQALEQGQQALEQRLEQKIEYRIAQAQATIIHWVAGIVIALFIGSIIITLSALNFYTTFVLSS